MYTGDSISCMSLSSCMSSPTDMSTAENFLMREKARSYACPRRHREKADTGLWHQHLKRTPNTCLSSTAELALKLLLSMSLSPCSSLAVRSMRLSVCTIVPLNSTSKPPSPSTSAACMYTTLAFRSTQSLRTTRLPRDSRSRLSAENSRRMASRTRWNSPAAREMRERTCRTRRTTASASSERTLRREGSSFSMKLFISAGAFSRSMLIQRRLAILVGT
mmetsp:Transcript_10911/g.22118  ORF Transcript_10911/g.22118 Transcript_10911/m.22118 type:complete len:219 (-) Transcript_10911:123-779(-)